MSGDIVVAVTVTITQGDDVTTRTGRKSYGGNLYATTPKSLEEVTEYMAKSIALDAVCAAKAARK